MDSLAAPVSPPISEEPVAAEPVAETLPEENPAKKNAQTTHTRRRSAALPSKVPPADEYDYPLATVKKIAMNQIGKEYRMSSDVVLALSKVATMSVCRIAWG